jgi:hypothetical protein
MSFTIAFRIFRQASLNTFKRVHTFTKSQSKTEIAGLYLIACSGVGAVGGALAGAINADSPVESLSLVPQGFIGGFICGAIGSVAIPLAGPLYVVTAPIRRVVTGKWFGGERA